MYNQRETNFKNFLSNAIERNLKPGLQYFLLEALREKKKPEQIKIIKLIIELLKNSNYKLSDDIDENVSLIQQSLQKPNDSIINGLGGVKSDATNTFARHCSIYILLALIFDFINDTKNGFSDEKITTITKDLLAIKKSIANDASKVKKSIVENFRTQLQPQMQKIKTTKKYSKIGIGITAAGVSIPIIGAMWEFYTGNSKNAWNALFFAFATGIFCYLIGVLDCKKNSTKFFNLNQKILELEEKIAGIGEYFDTLLQPLEEAASKMEKVHEM